jgi:hypothetical protein
VSTRHRSEVAKPDPSERRRIHHRDRQALRHALSLSVADPDELLDPLDRRTLQVEHRGAPQPKSQARRFRHWKAPFWKRRSASRRARNAALAALASSEAEPVLVPS